MPVDTLHPAYVAAAPLWRLVRDTIAGSRAVKAAGELYLPALYQQPLPEYDAYKRRALFVNATGRTAQGYLGMVMRKPPIVTIPKADTTVNEWILNTDGNGTEFRTFAETVMRELVSVSRCGTLIDWNEIAARPYLTHYPTESIINWEINNIGGRRTLTMLMLKEESSEYMATTGEQPSKDVYIRPIYTQWREFRLLSDKGIVTGVEWILWRKKVGKTESSEPESFVKVGGGTMLRKGKPLPAIPFVLHGAMQDQLELADPMLADLAEINVAHYMQSADYENGLHVCGIPTPWAAGFTDAGDKSLVLGTSYAWTTDKTDAKCGFLEFNGAGMSHIKDAMKEKESQMAALGARALEAPKADAESYDTVMLRKGGETNALVTAAMSATRSLSQVLQWVAWWTSLSTPDITKLANTYFVAVNQDLISNKASPQFIAAMVAAMQAGAISFQTFFHNMLQGELYDEDTDMESEQTRIKEEAPPPPAPLPGKPTPPAK